MAMDTAQENPAVDSYAEPNRAKFDTMPLVQDDTTVEPNQVTRADGVNNPMPAVNLRRAQTAGSSTAVAAEQNALIAATGSPTKMTDEGGY